MKLTRIKSREYEMVYHCVSRVVGGECLFGENEKRVFRSIMRKVADFCGVDVLTYCVMSNHIHVLCRIPPADLTAVTDLEIVRRYRVLFSTPSKYRPFDPDVLESLLKANEEKGKLARKLLLGRMHDVSIFMKILKLRMSIWFNKTHQRFGTLWAERFKSIVVEGRGNPLLTMAQYIDLNPVRAGMTTRSTDYPFCGITDAKHGNLAACKGIRLIALLSDPNLKAQDSIAWYEKQLEVTRQSRRKPDYTISPDKSSILPVPLLRRQPRLSKSLAMGSREFLVFTMQVFGAAFSLRSLQSGPYGGGFALGSGVYFGRQERPKNG